MELTDKKHCDMEGKVHRHGSTTCAEEVCRICNDGLWEEDIEIYPRPEDAHEKR